MKIEKGKEYIGNAEHPNVDNRAIYPHKVKVVAIKQQAEGQYINIEWLEGRHKGQTWWVHKHNLVPLETKQAMPKKPKKLKPLKNFRLRRSWANGMELLSDKGNAGRRSNATFIVLKDDGSYSETTNSACHSALQYGENERSQFVVSWVWNEHKHTRAFIQWLVAQSPYAGYIVNKGAKDVLKRGIIVRSSTPSNILSQIMVCTRQLWEYPKIVDTWAALVRGGVHPSVAFPLTHLIGKTNHGYTYSILAQHHNPMNGGVMDKTFFKNFLNNEPAKPNAPYNKNTNYKGLFILWGGRKHDRVIANLSCDVNKKIKQWGTIEDVRCASEQHMLEQVLPIAKKLEELIE